MMGRQERRALILALARRGARRRDIALQAGCSVRRVFQILEAGDAGTRDSGADDRQGDFSRIFRIFREICTLTPPRRVRTLGGFREVSSEVLACLFRPRSFVPG